MVPSSPVVWAIVPLSQPPLPGHLPPDYTHQPVLIPVSSESPLHRFSLLKSFPPSTSNPTFRHIQCLAPFSSKLLNPSNLSVAGKVLICSWTPFLTPPSPPHPTFSQSPIMLGLSSQLLLGTPTPFLPHCHLPGPSCHHLMWTLSITFWPSRLASHSSQDCP